MKVIKRNGSEAVFDITKIIAALNKANAAVPENARMDQEQILGADHLVDDRQDIVERALDNQAVGVVALRNDAHRGRGHVDIHAALLQVIDRLIGREGHAALRAQEEATAREAEKEVMTQICLGRKLRDACR